MARPICAYIDLSALRHNLNKIKTLANNSRIMAVVKANGYGHGIVRVAEALRDADAFAVASLGEALELRYAGISHPLVLLEGVFSQDELDKAFQYTLDIVVHSHEQLAMLLNCQFLGALRIWIKVDTGMHRLGFDPKEVASVYQQLSSLSCVAKPVGIMTHFASADMPEDALNEIQIMRFNAMLNDLPDDLPKSMASSAAIVHFSQCHHDWVRPGLMLYGVSPSQQFDTQSLGLLPVMTLVSEVIAVKNVAKGEYVGYAGSWQAEKDSVIAIVAVGYGDGYPRHAVAGTPVLIHGQLVPIVGRISMDMISVDVTHLPNIKVGSSVTLWGSGLPVEHIAQCSETIAYELLCGITRRVPCIVGQPTLS